MQRLTKLRVRHHQVDQAAVLGTGCTGQAQRAGVTGTDGAFGLRLCSGFSHLDPSATVTVLISWPLECGCPTSHGNWHRRVRSNGPRRICDVQGLSPREYQRQPHSRQLVKLMVCASAVRIECTCGPPGEHGRTRRPALSPCCREIERASGLGTQLWGWPQSVELAIPVAVPFAPPAKLLPGPKAPKAPCPAQMVLLFAMVKPG